MRLSIFGKRHRHPLHCIRHFLIRSTRRALDLKVTNGSGKREFFSMSQFRFAASAALILFVLAPAFAQDSGCEPRPAIPQCPTQDCQSGCRGSACIPADQLWANYANEIGCKGCVRYQKMTSNFPGLGGKPACDVKGCNPGSKACFGLPSMSISWPRPFHGSNANCNSMRNTTRKELLH